MDNPYERMKKDLINEAEEGVFDDSDSNIISFFSEGESDQIDDDIEEMEDSDEEMDDDEEENM